MGRSVSWLAVAGRAPGQVWEQLALVDTAEPTAPGSIPLAAALQPDGSVVLALGAFEHAMLHAEALTALSRGATVVAWTESESTNAARACAYRDGTLLWGVSHVLDRGTNDLAVEGKAPAALKKLRQKAIADQARDGHDAAFGVPAALAQAALGIDADALGQAAYTRLALADAERFPTPRAIWQRVQRVRLAEDFERGVANQAERLAAALDAPLAALGFVPQALPKPKAADFRKPLAAYTRTHRGFEQSVGIASFGGNAFDVGIAIRHDVIDQLVDRWITQIPGREGPTYSFGLRALEGERSASYHLASPADFEDFLELLAQRLPSWPDRLADFAALDARMQASYATTPLIEHGLKRRAALLAGAFLAGHGDMSALLAASTNTEKVMGQYQGLLEELVRIAPTL